MECKRCSWMRWGKHQSGRQRWRCRICGKAGIRQRSSRPHGLLKRFLIDGDTMTQLSERYRVHLLTVRNRLHRVFDQPPPLAANLIPDSLCWLVTDATHFKRWGCLLITVNPRDYWFKMKIRVKNDDGVQLSTNCRQLKLKSPDGKMRKTDCANTETLFRIIQSIPSPKAEPFKRWLARVGKVSTRQKLPSFSAKPKTSKP